MTGPLPPRSDAEGPEIVPGYLNVEVGRMSRETLRLFARDAWRCTPNEPGQTVVVEVIDGLLALREMG